MHFSFPYNINSFCLLLQLYGRQFENKAENQDGLNTHVLPSQESAEKKMVLIVTKMLILLQLYIYFTLN